MFIIGGGRSFTKTIKGLDKVLHDHVTFRFLGLDQYCVGNSGSLTMRQSSILVFVANDL